MGKQILSVTKQVNGRLEVSGLWCELRLCFNSVRAVRSVVSGALRPHGRQPARPLCPWDFPAKNTGVGCHALLQGIFPTQGLNPSLTSPALAGGFFTTSAT